jgi:hypothetical protein
MGIMRLARALLAAGVVAAGVGLAAPAHATSFNGVCETGEVCLWVDSNYGGPVFDDYNSLGYYPGNYFVNSSIGLNDNASSSANYDASNYCRMYVNAYGGGANVLMQKYGVYVNSSNAWYYSSFGWFNDQASSHYFSAS